MTRLDEDLVRAALSDGADLVGEESLRPLAGPDRRKRPAVSGRSRWLRWAGPVAAITVVGAGVLVVTAPQGRNDAEPVMSLAAYAGVKFVVHGAWPLGGKELTITDAATGRSIARVAAPERSSGFLDAAGVGDNRTFVVTTGDAKSCRTSFYLLKLREDGKPREFRALPKAGVRGRQGEGPDQLAAAQGGRRLAYSSLGCGQDRGQGHVTIVDSTTGKRRSVALPHGAKASDLRWSPDGKRLVFQLVADGWDGFRMNVLDAATGVRAPVPLGPPGTRLNVGQVSPDGDNLVAVASTAGKLGIVWYSLVSLKVVHQMPLDGAKDGPMTLSRTDKGSMVALIGDRLYRIRGMEVESKPVRGGTVDMTGTW